MAVDFRIFTEPELGAGYSELLRVARLAEETGFEGFFRSDHVLAMDGSEGLPGPTDAWTTLSALGRETTRIRLGTLVTAATFRLPGMLAITVAQADEMCGGRIELGLGAGWFAAEHAAYGIPFPSVHERFDRFTEQLEILSGLWATPPGARFSYAGTHYTLTDCPALPRPVQQPGPPVIIGGYGPRRTPALAARFAAEFNLTFASIDTAVEQFERVDAACRSAGREPANLPRSIGQTLALGRTDAEIAERALPAAAPENMRTNALAGSPAQVVDAIGRWRERTGIDRLYLQILDLADLGHIELFAAEVMPQLAAEGTPG